MKLTHRQKKLVHLIERQAQHDETDFHGGIRDMLTDLRHIADRQGEDWGQLLRGAAAVFREEKVGV